MDFGIRDDDELLAALREALDAAHHPQLELVVASARDAFTYQRLDEELAQLVYDSLLDVGVASATRAREDPRVVVFENDAISIEIEIIGDTIVGQVAPPGQVRVTVEVPEQAALQVHTDKLGCFSLTAASLGALSRGPLRLQIERGEDTTVTEWTRIPPMP
jgi:hypothetical protein